MTVVSSKRASRSYSDNRKSKIQNLKCVVGVFSLIITFVGLAGMARAQPKKVPRIGYLSAFERTFESTRSEAIRLALRQRGYIEGQNVATEYRYVSLKPGRNSELAAELVRLKVDVIVVAGADD